MTTRRRTRTPKVAAPTRARWEIPIEDWTPPRLNQLLGHHMARHRLKKGCSIVIALAAFAAGVPKADRKRRVSLVITLGPRMRGADPDAYWKGLLDSCVAAGLLIDDSPTWCELGPVTYARGPRKGTTIILEDMNKETRP